MSAPTDRLHTCSQRPVPDECAHRIDADLRSERMTGVLIGLIGATAAHAVIAVTFALLAGGV